jgi:hypothetical protein
MLRDPTAGSWLDHCRVEVLELCRIALRDVSEMEADDPSLRPKPKLSVNRSMEFDWSIPC